ncbi:ROK family protein [Streptomyces sp. NPDC087903]|uniref:ROK family protein n=1 Tax=Streptomyces sp. NPDC087903 TaxID=3365819 RepID=UPI0038040DEA
MNGRSAESGPREPAPRTAGRSGDRSTARPASRSAERGDTTRVEILALLSTAGPLDRRQIAKLLRLGVGTVHEHTRRLLEAGYLQALDAQSGTVGRPRIPLRVVPEAAATLGIRIATDHLVAVVVGLDGRMETSVVHPFDPAQTADPIAQLLTVIRGYLDTPALRTRVKAVGVATPDTVDPDTGYLHFAPRFGWTDFPLGRLLRDQLPVPVLVDNDLTASTTAELLYGAGREYDDFLVLALGDGVGLSAVLDRKVHRGPGGVSGTFGHTYVSDTGVLCACGARGCLETFTNDQGILRAACRRELASADTDIAEIRTRAIAGDPDILALLADVGAILGRALAGVVNLLGTPTIAVIGDNYVLWPGLEPGFLDAMRTSPVTAAHRVKVTVRPWTDSQHAWGAASLALGAPGTLTRL